MEDQKDTIEDRLERQRIETLIMGVRQTKEYDKQFRLQPQLFQICFNQYAWWSIKTIDNINTNLILCGCCYNNNNDNNNNLLKTKHVVYAKYSLTGIRKHLMIYYNYDDLLNTNPLYKFNKYLLKDIKYTNK